MKLEDHHKEVLEARAVDPRVRDARGYHSWTFENPQPLHDAWRPYINESQYPFITKVTNQSGGIVIPRYEIPGYEHKPLSAEVRPDHPIMTEPAYNAMRRVDKPDANLAEEYERAIRDVDDLLGEDPNATWLAELMLRYPLANLGKYIHCPGRTYTAWYEHDHDEVFDGKPEKRAKHVKHDHNGVDVVGPHRHSYTAKKLGDARRLDMNPLPCRYLTTLSAFTS